MLFLRLKHPYFISLHAKFMRRWFPKTYARSGRQRAERAYREPLRGLPGERRREMKNQLTWEIQEWSDLLAEIEDAELVAKAAKMDIRLDEIPAPFSESENRRSHYEVSNFGYRLVCYETRNVLRNQIRDREPAFRKERRELVELYIKIIVALTGLLGGATGLVALLKK